MKENCSNSFSLTKIQNTKNTAKATKKIPKKDKVVL